jgi:hypothetical protein
MIQGLTYRDWQSDIGRQGLGGNANPSATSGESIKMRGIVVLIKLSLIFK